MECDATENKFDWRFAMPFGLAGLALYAATCAPGVVWQDSAMFQSRVWCFDLAGDLGLALAHPLYVLLAKAFTLLPLGDFALRVNLFSGVCAAACLVVFADLTRALTGSRGAAAVATILLAVSHTFWTHAVIAEVYNLYALGLVLELRLLLAFVRGRGTGWFVAAVFVNGLNLANHLLAILHWPAYLGLAIWAVRAGRLRGVQVPLWVVAWCVGATPYLYLIVVELLRQRSVGQVLLESLVGPASRKDTVLIVSFDWWAQIRNAFLYFAMNFPTPLAALAPIGAWAAWRRRELRPLIAASMGIFLVGFGFSFRYLVPDQYVFFYPCYVLFVLFVGIGVNWLVGLRQGRLVYCLIATLFPVVAYELAPGMVQRSGKSLGLGRGIALRDDRTYFLRPRKNGEDSAERFARAALQQAAPDGLLWADTTIKNVLVYVRDCLGVEPGVTLTHGYDTTPRPPVIEPTSEAVRPFADRGAAYVCSNLRGYVLDWVPIEYDLQPVGLVYRLVPRAVRELPK